MLYTNLLVNDVWSASLKVAFRSANSLAASMRLNARERATSVATLFQTMVEFVLVFTPWTICASRVCAGVRVVLFTAPSDLVSLKSCAYRALVIEGGEGGKN
jgi:hypothetical protein